MDGLMAGIAGARRIDFPGAGHMLNIERPQDFDRAVLDFIGHTGQQ